MDRNQIGFACAGSNPAVRVGWISGRARVVKGFDSNMFFITRIPWIENPAFPAPFFFFFQIKKMQ